MYQSELHFEHARERYEEYIVAARIRRLIREAQPARQPAAPPARGESLIARVVDALRPRRTARA